MIIVLASIKVKNGCMDEFLRLFRANVPHVLAEKGCIEYFPTVDFHSGMAPQSLDPAVVTIVEKWESLDALKDHLASPHMGVHRKATKEMVEGMELKILQEAES